MWLFVCVIFTTFPLPCATCWMTSRIFFFKWSRRWMASVGRDKLGVQCPFEHQRCIFNFSSLWATQLFIEGKSCRLLAEKENLGHHWVRCQKLSALDMNDQCFHALIIGVICHFMALNANHGYSLSLFFSHGPSAYRTISI
mgnify:CR=1 FL=1